MKTISILLATLITWSGLSLAADNSTYIDQSGDYTSILVQQDGAGNTVRGVTSTARDTPAIMYGDSNYINIEQKGSGNTLAFGIQTKIADTPMSWTSEYSQAVISANSFVYTVVGSNNMATIDSNSDNKSTSIGNGVYLQQIGNLNTSTVNLRGSGNGISAVVAGNSNALTGVIDGTNNKQDVYITGDSNTLGFTQTGENNGIIGGTIGYGNTLRLSQQDFGRTVHVEVLGNNNSISIAQAGTSDSPVNIIFRGNYNYYNVNTNTR
jgi:minor curlin subunit